MDKKAQKFWEHERFLGSRHTPNTPQSQGTFPAQTTRVWAQEINNFWSPKGTRRARNEQATTDPTPTPPRLPNPPKSGAKTSILRPNPPSNTTTRNIFIIRPKSFGERPQNVPNLRLRPSPSSAEDGKGVRGHTEQDRKNSPGEEKRSPKCAKGGRKKREKNNKNRDGHVSTKCGLRVKKKEKEKGKK